MKAGSKQRKRLAESSGYVGNRREMEGRKLVPVGSPVGQNDPPVPIGSRTQPSEPIGEENKITSMALKRAVCVGIGKYKEEAVKL
jgi:hypothetical protein